MNKEWGQWLRAHPRRAAGGGRSKWLVKYDDGEWGRQVERDNDKAVKLKFQKTNFRRTEEIMRDRRDSTAINAGNSGPSGLPIYNSKQKEGNLKDIGPDGLDSEEQYGLNLEERKRQRRESHDNETQQIQQGKNSLDSAFSETNCLETTPSFWAKLAVQAS